MRKSKILSVTFFFCAVSALAQSPYIRSDVVELHKILTENHFKVPVIDDKFSKQVFDHMVNELDPEKIIFTQEDLSALSVLKDKFDDEWNAGTIDFVNKVTLVTRAATNKSNKYFAEVLKENINWKTAEMLVHGKHADAPANDAALRERVRSWVKYEVLDRVNDELDQDTLRKKILLPALLKQEIEQRKALSLEQQKKPNPSPEVPGALENKVVTIYLKSVMACFDPHSIYLPPTDIENVMGSLSSREFSFGLGLKENEKGDVFIERLVPGGPAWKSGQLHQHDLLISLKAENQQIVDLTGIGLAKLAELLDGNHLTIELTVKQPDGARHTVKLRKEKIEDDSNIVKGFVLKGKSKIGYISLPGFYADWGSEKGSSCANDVARQILKLKKENIQGLILDIRSNGGGSVAEAIEMAGIFIDEGPLAVFKNRTGKITTLRDINRGTIYDGPMALLVNGRSASASEMLAGVLQDYNRAFIVGSATFGKATSQRIFSLEPQRAADVNLDPSRKPDYGFATVTIEKIYRVSGKSVQGWGVKPDITLPDIYENLIEHESALPAALVQDSVVKKIPYTAGPALPVMQLKTKSDVRVNSNAWFNFIRQANALLVDETKKRNHSTTLDWDEYLNNPSLALLDDRKVPHPHAVDMITAPEFDKAQIARIPYLAENNATWIKNLTQDEYVAEAFLLLNDYIHTAK